MEIAVAMSRSWVLTGFARRPTAVMPDPGVHDHAGFGADRGLGRHPEVDVWPNTLVEQRRAKRGGVAKPILERDDDRVAIEVPAQRGDRLGGGPGLDEHEDNIAAFEIGGIRGGSDGNLVPAASAFDDREPVRPDRREMIGLPAIEHDTVDRRLRTGAILAGNCGEATRDQGTHGAGANNCDPHDSEPR